jgi:hypothetical protein
MVQPIGEPEPYERFRSGLTFSDVCAELRREADQAMELEGRRMFWTRRTVLGRWHEHKLAAYEAYRRWFAPPRPEWWDDYAPVRR